MYKKPNTNQQFSSEFVISLLKHLFLTDYVSMTVLVISLVCTISHMRRSRLISLLMASARYPTAQFILKNHWKVALIALCTIPH